MTEISIAVDVNGRVVEATVPARLTLADFLRDRLGLTGTHLGCEQGICGACNVLIDGQSMRSCLMLAVQAHGRTVTTIEGLNQPSGLSVLQQELADRGGLQCGFCTPGFVVSITELLDQEQPVDEPQVRRALDGNICRCTGYEGIVDAVLALAGTRSHPPGDPQ